MVTPGFEEGIVIGLIGGLVFSFVLRQFGYARAKMRAAVSPQSVSQKTSKTPWQVVWEAITAAFGCSLIVLVILALIWMWWMFGRGG